MNCFVLIREATSSPLASQMTGYFLQSVAVAVTYQLQRDVAPYYSPGGSQVRVGANAQDIGPGEIAFAIVDELPDAPGAIAYHDINGQDVPVAFLALSTCNSLDDVSTAISHECCETEGDRACNVWSDAGTGFEYARELCDAVESNFYRHPNGIALSDFVLPSFFEPNGVAPFSFVEVSTDPVTVGAYATTPFATAAGGYQIQRQSGGGETQVTGKSHHLARKKHWNARTYRRGVRLT